MLQKLENNFDLQGFYRIHYLELSAGHTKPSIPYEGWSITFIDKGAAMVEINNVPVKVENGQGFFLRPHADNTIKVCPDKAANLYIAVFEMENNSLDDMADKIYPMTGVIRGYLKIMLKEAKFAYINDLRVFNYPELKVNPNAPFGSQQILRIYTELLLLEITRQHHGNARADYAELTRETLIMQNIDINPLFDQLVNYLEQNINQQLTIEQISRDNFISSSKVQKAFRECANEGAISFLQKMKIEKAKTLIRETSLNFTEISELLGFSSVHHFSKKFKQLVKMSPSSYQNFVK